jgi:hypothetical protein
MNKHGEKRIGFELPAPKARAGKAASRGRGKTDRTEIRREASATQHASRASLRTPERSGQKRSQRPAKKG